MPIYDFACTLEHRFERYLPNRSDPNPECATCGAATERVWGLGNTQKGGGTFPYITTHLTGKPVEVKSASHLESLCKRYGVTHRPDTAFLEKTYEGWDHAKKKHVYREGSGAGLPGSWI